MEKGQNVVIEGHDGTGKSTQIRLLGEKLAYHGIESIVFEEPAGGPISNAIRTIIKNGSLEREAMTDLLLFSASRCELWRRIGKSALKAGKWIVSARNYYSSIAYQGYGLGLDLKEIENITRIATDEQYMNPDYAFLLSLDDEDERARRINRRGILENTDPFESRQSDFQERVRLGYIAIAKDRNIPIISASQPVETISNEIWSYIEPYIK